MCLRIASPAINRVGGGGRPEKILLSRLDPLPWSHLVPSPKQSKASESQIKFARNKSPLSGKGKTSFPDSKSTARDFFTDDYLKSTAAAEVDVVLSV